VGDPASSLVLLFCCLERAQVESSRVEVPGGQRGYNILCGVCAIVHEEHVQVVGVVNEESLVAGRHHVAGLLV